MIRIVCCTYQKIAYELLNKVLKMPFYAVALGRVPGVYTSWEQCLENTSGYQGAKFKKFSSEALALEFLNKETGTATGKRKSDDIEEMNPYNKKRLVSPLLTNHSSSNDNTASGSSLKNCPNKEDDYKEKIHNLEERVRTLEERVEALEASKALHDESTGNECDAQKINDCGKDNDKSATANLVPRHLRDELLRKATNPIPIGSSSRSYSTKAVKKDGPGSASSSMPFCTDAEDFVLAYTDGACSANGRAKAKAGVGVWFSDGHPLNVSEPVKGRATNNVAEIQAATRAVERAAQAGIKKLCIMTDSMFMINCMTKWIGKWRKNNWKTANGEAVINKHELIELMEALKTHDVTVKWTHVPGHRGVHGNEQADALARAGAELYKATGILSII